MAIEPNGPRTSEGASGFGSHVSSWLGPPTNSSRITDRSAGTSSEDPRANAGAKAPSQPRPRPPRRKTSRRPRSKPSALLPWVCARISRSPGTLCQSAHLNATQRQTTGGVGQQFKRRESSNVTDLSH